MKGFVGIYRAYEYLNKRNFVVVGFKGLKGLVFTKRYSLKPQNPGEAMKRGDSIDDISRLFIYYVGRKRDQQHFGEEPANPP